MLLNLGFPGTEKGRLGGLGVDLCALVTLKGNFSLLARLSVNFESFFATNRSEKGNFS